MRWEKRTDLGTSLGRPIILQRYSRDTSHRLGADYLPLWSGDAGFGASNPRLWLHRPCEYNYASYIIKVYGSNNTNIPVVRITGEYASSRQADDGGSSPCEPGGVTAI